MPVRLGTSGCSVTKGHVVIDVRVYEKTRHIFNVALLLQLIVRRRRREQELCVIGKLLHKREISSVYHDDDAVA